MMKKGTIRLPYRCCGALRLEMVNSSLALRGIDPKHIVEGGTYIYG